MKEKKKRLKFGASDTAQQVKVLVAKPDDPSLSPGTHTMKDRTNFCKLSLPLMCVMAYANAPQINKCTF